MQTAKKTRLVKKRSVSMTNRNSTVDAKKPVTKRPPGVSLKVATNGKTSITHISGNPSGIRRAATLLKQVSDGTRLQILLLLLDSEKHVGAICEFLGNQSQPAVSHHLAKLRDGRLIEPRREGKNNIYALTEEGLLLAQTVKSLTWMNS